MNGLQDFRVILPRIHNFNKFYYTFKAKKFLLQSYFFVGFENLKFCCYFWHQRNTKKKLLSHLCKFQNNKLSSSFLFHSQCEFHIERKVTLRNLLNSSESHDKRKSFSKFARNLKKLKQKKSLRGIKKILRNTIIIMIMSMAFSANKCRLELDIDFRWLDIHSCLNKVKIFIVMLMMIGD